MLSEHPELRASAKFLLGVIVAFAVLYAFSLALPLVWVEQATAQAAVSLLGIFGIEGSINAAQEPVVITLAAFPDFPQIQISYLCTGLLELLVVWAAIIASFGIGARKRLLGVLGAFALGFAFNQARIAATVLTALSFETGFAEIVHGILFRAVLFAVVAGYYAAWFWWATRQRTGFLSTFWKRAG